MRTHTHTLYTAAAAAIWIFKKKERKKKHVEMSCERVFEQHPDRPLLGRIRRGGFTGTCFSSPCVCLIKRKFEIKSNNSRSWWVFFFSLFSNLNQKLDTHSNGLTDIKMRLTFGFINLIYERLNPFLFFNRFITTEQVEYNPANALNRERLKKKKKRENK